MAKLFLKPRPKTAPVPPPPQPISRAKAIAILRHNFLKELESRDGEVSMCKLAAERGIFCHGFAQYGDGQLRRVYDWIAQKDATATREDLEELANRWQIARQEVREMPLACDVQQREHDTCRGWDDFSNEQLAAFVEETTGKRFLVVSS